MVDLWPNDINHISVEAPVSILRKQASLLGQKTKNLVEAEVSLARDVPGTSNDLFYYAFYITAPTLNYRFKLFTIAHGVSLYPVRILPDSDIAKNEIVAQSEQEFLSALQEILNADKTKQVIQSLLAQVDPSAHALIG